MVEDPKSCLEDRWSELESCFPAIVDELTATLAMTKGSGRAVIYQLRQWFSSSSSVERARENPYVLAVCNGVLSELEQGSIRSGVQRGLTQTLECSVSRRSLIQIWRTTCLLILGCYLLALLWGFQILPGFSKSFSEFGIELPELTKFVLGAAVLVQRTSPAVLLILFGLTLMIVVDNLLFRKAGVESWLWRRLRSRRAKSADSAWHLSELLKSGMPPFEACEVAAKLHGLGWLRLKKQIRDPLTESGWEVTVPVTVQERVPLIAAALSLASTEASTVLLREIAFDNWFRCRAISEWFVGLVNSVIFWGAVWAIGIAQLAMLAPLVQLTSGLTGGW